MRDEELRQKAEGVESRLTNHESRIATGDPEDDDEEEEEEEKKKREEDEEEEENDREGDEEPLHV